MKLDLAEIKKRFQPHATLAVTLESSRMAVELVRRENGGCKVAQTFSIPLSADDVVKNAAQAGSELAAALENANIKERRCVVCVPPGWALSTSAEMPEVSAEDLRSYLELRAEREFPIPAAELRLAHCAYFLPDGKHRATLAAIPAKRLEAVEKMLEAAGCHAISISLGLDGCFTNSNTALHFLANGNHVDLVVTAGGGVVEMRSFASATPAGETAAAFSREIRVTLGRLPEAVRKQVRTAHFAGPRDAAQSLCRQTRLDLIRLGIDSPDCGSDAIGTSAPDAPGTAAATAMALLLEKPVPFEFVIKEAHPWEAAFKRYNTKRYRRIGAAALAFIVVPILMFAWRSHAESSLESQWDGMRREVTELETLQQKIRQFHAWFNPAPESVQILDGLVAAFPEQGDAWAKSIQVSEDSKITCTGFARNQPALMALMDRLRSRKDVSGLQLQQIRGNNPVQFSLTYKWEAVHDK